MFGGLTASGTTRKGEAVQNALPHFVAAELWDHFIGEADLVDRVLPERQALLRKQQVCKDLGCKGLLREREGKVGAGENVKNKCLQYFSGTNVLPFNVPWSSYWPLFDRLGSFTFPRGTFL